MSPANATNSIQIVEYEPRYAQAVADMWNCSQESWGGNSRIRTAENVAREHENAGHLKVFLALHGNEVVGYCSFSYYRQDEGALFVPLLNVRPDFHGHKIGKALILKAVETTVELGWPRLDLFTWAGNTKAVPMYKKCGFFWEKKDNSVHLMNFIPTVLQTEALAPYLGRIDWYADSLRSLDIQPDGRMENGFDYFEYAWRKDGTSLRVEFEKTGRGIRLIETDDYSIHTEIDGHALVFGSAYPVRYIIRNKSGAPLECTIRGRDDMNLQFELNRTVRVQDTMVVEGEFYIDPVFEEQSDWKTHPAVVSQWTINGKAAEFRTGIAPKFPAGIGLEVKGQEQYTGVAEEAFLTFENHYKEAAEFELKLPACDFADFGLSFVSVRIPAQGKAAVKIPYTLRRFGLYSVDAEIKAMPDNGEPILFTRRLYGVFKGNTGRFGGEIADHWIAVNGPYTVGLNKRNNELWTSHLQGGRHTSWFFPRLGRPYSIEFSKKKAESVDIYPDGDAMVLAAEYRPEEAPGMVVTALTRLNANGIVERYFEVRHDSGAAIPEDLYLADAFDHETDGLVLPYDGDYYDLKDRYAAGYDDWDMDRMTENWLFSRHAKPPRGFCWDASAKLVKLDWHFGIEYALGRPSPGTTIRTGSSFLAIGTYADWWDFRCFARKRRDPVRPLLRDHWEWGPSGRNPFAGSASELKLRQHRNQPIDGTLTVSLSGGKAEPIRTSFHREEQVYEAAFALPESGGSGRVEKVQLIFEAEDLRTERRTVVIPVTGAPVEQEVCREAAGERYRCSNGPLTIEASPAFGAVLHSLRYNGEEWLDSSFPEPGPRSWWNPWHGGISASIPNLSPLSRQEERRDAGFVSLKDNRSNEWTGISLNTYIEKHEKYRGIQLSLFALLLPGAPVLCCVTRLTNRTGLVYTHFKSTIDSFFHPGRSLREGWAEAEDEVRYRCGQAGADLASEGIIRFGSDHRSDILHAVSRYPGTDAWLYTNNRLIQYGVTQGRSIEDGESVWTAPVFFAFADQPLSYDELRGLAEIRFDDNRG